MPFVLSYVKRARRRANRCTKSEPLGEINVKIVISEPLGELRTIFSENDSINLIICTNIRIYSNLL